MKTSMKKWLAAALSASLLAGSAVAFAAANGEPASLDADTVEYDMGTGIITAEGNVLMKRGVARVAGATAQYNSKTQEGYVKGNVIAVREDMRMTCNELVSDGQEHMRATGNVHGTQQDKAFSGDQVDYFPQQNDYLLMEAGGVLSNADGTFTAARIEGWLKDEHYIGTGAAHLVSPAKNAEVGGDQMDYTKGVVVATGNAWAVQENNTMRANKLTVRLDQNGQAQVQ